LYAYLKFTILLASLKVKLDPNSTEIKKFSNEKKEEFESASEAEESQASDSEVEAAPVEAAPVEMVEYESDKEQSNPWLKSSTKPLMKSLKNSNDQFARVGKQTKALEKLARTRKEFISSTSEDLTQDSAAIITLDSQPETEARKITYEDSDSDSDYEREKVTMAHKRDLSAMSQMQVMEMAFADDDIIQDFEGEKAALIESDLPVDKDVTLPGWGSWAGNGVKAKKNVVVERVVKRDAIVLGKRKDAHLKHVIINEKRQKKVCSGCFNDLEREIPCAESTTWV
jgi:U3 small nucleolar RNA-associated protein 14